MASRTLRSHSSWSVIWKTPNPRIGISRLLFSLTNGVRVTDVLRLAVSLRRIRLQNPGAAGGTGGFPTYFRDSTGQVESGVMTMLEDVCTILQNLLRRLPDEPRRSLPCRRT